MKNQRILFSLAFSVLLLANTSCSKKTSIIVIAPKTPAGKAEKAPPGQVKKMTGSKSAKPYAPGQQKKKH